MIEGMSMPIVLGVAPLFDEATKYSYEWLLHAWDSTREKLQWEVLLVEKATRSMVEQKVSEKTYDLIVFYDHGDENGLMAQGGATYCIDKQNLDRIRASTGVIYSMACLSAASLGVEFWKRGGIYIGYTKIFGFTVEEKDLFRDAANSGLIAYANGERNWMRIKQIMIEKYNEAIKKARDAWSKIWLTRNRDSLVVYDGEAPQPRCLFRRIAVKLLGEEKGWLLTWEMILGYALFGFGVGLAIHDFFIECADPLRFPPHGFWFGIMAVMIGVALFTASYLRRALRLIRRMRIG